jgi:magnesium-transporting ATPase (P-type)
MFLFNVMTKHSSVLARLQMLISSLILTLLFVPQLALAQNTLTPDEVLNPQVGTATGLGTTDIRITVARIIRVAMSLLGIVAVVIVLIGGFTWMTAGGDEEKVGTAKKYIYSGVIGLAIILSAYAIANFVITQLVSATTQPGPPTL